MDAVCEAGGTPTKFSMTNKEKAVPVAAFSLFAVVASNY